jgi:hypothetical protein
MCLDHDHEASAKGGIDASAAVEAAAPDLSTAGIARQIAAMPELRRPHIGFIGYGGTGAGQRVLLGVDSHYESELVELIASALRERGARVDVVWADAGPDREFDDLDEIRVTIRSRHWTEEPRRWEGLPWIEQLAEAGGYDLLVHGKGGPTRETGFRYEQVPWLRVEHLEQGGGIFPADLHELINLRTWERIWKHGRGGRVRLSDPEGTDLTWTMHEGYFDGSRRGFNENPVRSFGHLHGHPPQPILSEDDCTGTIAGTTGHYSRAFPTIRLHLEAGRVEAIEGGAGYGQAWSELLAATAGTQYPCFPRPGLFWLWETAIGTNPRVQRPSRVNLLSSGGFEWERRRSGVIHCGIGTRWRASEEEWAAEHGITYGHLHVHLLFPTYEITTLSGEKVRVIENGRLCALDDPEVRELARSYGDPDQVLREDWIPAVPGITAPGSYADFAADPGRWIYE